MNASSRSVTSLSALLESLSALQSHEAAISSSLAGTLSNQQPIEESINRIHSLRPHLEKLQHESTVLSHNVSVTARTAERVGGRVKTLDEKMTRLKDAADIVNQTMELKAALASLQFAMDSQDWELATRHCARAMAVPIQVISGPFAETAIPSSELPLPPVQTLQNARESLLKIFRSQFRLASQARDATVTSRFFKLFPIIGWEDEGLEEYSTFVVDLVRTRSPTSAKTTSPVYYIAMLTSLFEGMALIIDQHQPIIEKYYGSDKMVVVVRRLIEECDHVVTRLCEGWVEERSAKRKLTQIENSKFASLKTERKPSSQLDEDLDVRDVDKLLFELAGMAGRWGLFRYFVCDRLREDHNSDSPLAKDAVHDNSIRISSISLILEASKTKKTIEDLLNSYYTPLEVWHLRMTIDKANRLSTIDAAAIPPLTTTPDDVFYIFKSVLHRLLSTSSVSITTHIIIELQEVMIQDYAGVMKKRLDDVYNNSNANTTGHMRDRIEKENKTRFITYLNDLDVSATHTERLVKDLLSTSSISQNFSDDEMVTVKSSISSLLELIPHLQAVQNAGIEQLFNQLARPRLKSLVSEMYKDITYVLEENAYAISDSLDIVRKRFIRNWEIIMDGFKDNFTEHNFAIFFSNAVEIFVRLWEKFLCGMRYTEFGAIRLDRDIRSILAYLSSQTAFGGMREKFQRLQQISTLLNLDVEEDGEEFYHNSGITWRLNLTDVRNIIALRV